MNRKRSNLEYIVDHTPNWILAVVGSGFCWLICELLVRNLLGEEIF